MPVRRHTSASSAPTRLSVIKTVGSARKPKETSRSIDPSAQRNRSAGAFVAGADEAQAIAEMRGDPPRPFGVGGALPRRCRLDFGRGEVVERDIAAVAARRTETARAEGAGHRQQRRYV